MTFKEDSRKPRVLLVDDDGPLRQHLVDRLSDEFDMEGAGDGEQALRCVLLRAPDLIVTDIVMPGMDGVQLVRTLRETPSTATIPVLMISGRAADELRHAFDLGADSYLGKPYTERELRARIRAMLHNARLRTETARKEERDRAARAAIEERAALLESITDAFYALDSEWRFSYVNQRALDYFRTTRDALIGRVIWDIFPDLRGTRTQREFERAVRENASISFEILSSILGRWIEIHAYPGKQGLAVNFRDITDRKEAAAALEQRVEAAIEGRKRAIEQLAQMQKMETIGQLTGGVAHDFNNLLTPIVGALDMINRRLDGDPHAQRVISGALQAADRAKTLIQRLLAFARRQHLEVQSVNIRALIAGMGDLLARTLGPHVELSMQVPPDLPAARVDPNQLELALLNLAVNARDAMPSGGTLRITVHEETIDNGDRVSPGRYVRITVSDTGRGMDAETLNRAIEPFFTTKGPGRGTGLGLSMVHGLAAQSGGDLMLTSQPGHGTTATLWIPVSLETAQDTDESSADTAPVPDGAGTILLVDDEDLVRLGTSAMLQDSGFVVIDAASGDKALQLLREGLKVDALLTDFAMPGMNGVDLARAVRKLYPDMPVLMITGYAALSDRDGGNLPRLSKPFRQTELIASVAEVLSQRAF